MAEGGFDIYQTDAGYAAVTNPVQRQILDALRGGEQQLPGLMKVTGRSKPTLSSLHVRELLVRELIDERPHPTDSRRKVYRLRAQKIGSSDLPVGQLRDAVQRYVGLRPLANRLPVAAVLQALAAAPAGTDAAVLRAQGARLGELAAPQWAVGSVRDLWMRIAGFLEEQEVATPLRVDLRKGHVDLWLSPALRPNADAAAAALAGLLEGVARGKGLGMAPVRFTVLAEGIRLQA